MARPRVRRKQKVGKKVTRKPASKKLHFVNEIVRAHWDPKKTLKQNYETLGLAEKVNDVTRPDPLADIIKSGAITIRMEDGTEQPLVLEEPKKELGPVALEFIEKLKALEEMPKLRHVSQHEQMILMEMVQRHGFDFDKMAKDLKLNTYQFSAGQLKRKVNLMAKTVEINL